jgi:hypothetical protein
VYSNAWEERPLGERGESNRQADAHEEFRQFGNQWIVNGTERGGAVIHEGCFQ